MQSREQTSPILALASAAPYLTASAVVSGFPRPYLGPDHLTVAQAQAGLDEFCEQVSDQRERISPDGNRCTVADLADLGGGDVVSPLEAGYRAVLADPVPAATGETRRAGPSSWCPAPPRGPGGD